MTAQFFAFMLLLETARYIQLEADAAARRAARKEKPLGACELRDLLTCRETSASDSERGETSPRFTRLDAPKLIS